MYDGLCVCHAATITDTLGTWRKYELEVITADLTNRKDEEMKAPCNPQKTPPLKLGPI